MATFRKRGPYQWEARIREVLPKIWTGMIASPPDEEIKHVKA